MEKSLDELIQIAVLQINGAMYKHIFLFIKLFTLDIILKRFDLRVIVATAAANIGIEPLDLIWVLWVGIPWCITALLQEREHNA